MSGFHPHNFWYIGGLLGGMGSVLQGSIFEYGSWNHISLMKRFLKYFK